MKATIQVILFFLIASMGVMGVFCLLCFVAVQCVEPLPWVRFGELLTAPGAAVLLYWLWWKFNVLGCARAVERFSRRAAERKRRWAETSLAYQIIIVILTICTMLHIAFQSHDLRSVLRGKTNQVGPANGSEPIRSETNRTSPAAGSRGSP
jgi:hypothetical protein